GPALEQHMLGLGWSVVAKRVLPDEIPQIAETLEAFADGGNVDLVLTTGGTGLSPRDVTPEATRSVADREVPGFGELMRAEGLKKTRLAPHSRGGAATLDSTLIVNLPGSPKGAVDSLVAVAELIPHAIDLLQNRTEHQHQQQQ